MRNETEMKSNSNERSPSTANFNSRTTIQGNDHNRILSSDGRASRSNTTMLSRNVSPKRKADLKLTIMPKRFTGGIDAQI